LSQTLTLRLAAASEQKRSQCGDEERECDDEQACPAQRLHSRRREIMSRAHQRLAAADGGKREREAGARYKMTSATGQGDAPRCCGCREKRDWCGRLNATVNRPQMTVRSRIPRRSTPPVAIVSRSISRPTRERIHSSPIAAAASSVARSSGKTWPVNRRSPMALTTTAAA
jgi:hypothetical protein